MMKLMSILLAICAGLAITVTCQQQRIRRLATDREQLLVMAQDSGRIARTYINLHGHEVSKNKVLDLSYRNLKELAGNKEFKALDQFDGLRKDKKNLEQLQHIDVAINKELKLKTGDTAIFSHRKSDVVVGSPGDTVKARTFSYTDEWNQISGIMVGDSTSLDIHIQVPIDGVIYWQRRHYFVFKKWRWGKKDYFSEFTSINKFVKIKDSRVLKIQKTSINN